MSVLPSVTAKPMRRSSPRFTLPGLTRPPSLMRAPATTCCSAISVGELKNTMDCLSALRTRASAIANTPRLPPIKTRRRCLRVITIPRSPAQPQPLGQLVDAADLVGIAGQSLPRLDGGLLCLATLAQHHIG